MRPNCAYHVTTKSMYKNRYGKEQFEVSTNQPRRVPCQAKTQHQTNHRHKPNLTQAQATT